MLTGGRQHRLLLQCYQGRRKHGVHELWPMRSCRGGGGGAEHGAVAAAAAEEGVPSALARGSGLDGAVCVGGEGCRARDGGGVAERTGPRLGPRRCGGGVPSPGAHLAAEAARGGRGRLGSGPLSHGAQRGVAFATGSWGVVERGIARRSGQAPTAPRARGGAAPPPGCEGGRAPPVRAVRALAQRGQPRHVGAVRPDGSRRRGRPVARSGRIWIQRSGRGDGE